MSSLGLNHKNLIPGLLANMWFTKARTFFC